MMKAIRRHLGWKIFLSYLIVLLVGFIVLATATEYSYGVYGAHCV